MKFNSQICTTKEQSERLLALGLKKETADMCLNTILDVSYTFSYSEAQYFLECKGLDKQAMKSHIPAWSLHRLIEIAGVHCVELYWHEGIYEKAISLIEERIDEEMINSKYLEGGYDKKKNYRSESTLA